jgi:hypothetical protein
MIIYFIYFLHLNITSFNEIFSLYNYIQISYTYNISYLDS